MRALPTNYCFFFYCFGINGLSLFDVGSSHLPLDGAFKHNQSNKKNPLKNCCKTHKVMIVEIYVLIDNPIYTNINNSQVRNLYLMNLG